MRSDDDPSRHVRQGSDSADAGGLAWAVAACGVTTALAVPLRGALAEANLLMFYLLAVALVSVRFGRKPGIVASILSVLAFDVFMVQPYFSLTVADPQYLLTLAIMLIVSLLISHLTATLRQQAQLARRGELRARALFELSRQLSGALSNEQIATIAVRHLNATFEVRAVILYPDEECHLIAPAVDGPHGIALAQTQMVIAKLVYDREVTVGYDEGALTSAGIRYLPLRAPMCTRGVLVIVPAAPASNTGADQEHELQTCAAQIALAMERVHYGDVAQSSLLEIESERLRNSLLSSVSHDIRTPLTAITGLAATLASRLPVGIDAELAGAIGQSAMRMNTMVTNLLDMARLQDGRITLNRQWQTLEEVVGGALAQLGAALDGTQVDICLPATLPLIEVDAVLLERVLCNLLDNALKHAGSGATIGLTARTSDALLEVAIEDNGPGIAPAMETAIFAKFSRVDGESALTGVGLGLSICKTIIEAHGGLIRAEARPCGGARFVFTLPLGAPPLAELD